jgi:hypothetical protein
MPNIVYIIKRAAGLGPAFDNEASAVRYQSAISAGCVNAEIVSLPLLPDDADPFKRPVDLKSRIQQLAEENPHLAFYFTKMDTDRPWFGSVLHKGGRGWKGEFYCETFAQLMERFEVAAHRAAFS